MTATSFLRIVFLVSILTAAVAGLGVAFCALRLAGGVQPVSDLGLGSRPVINGSRGFCQKHF